MSSFAFDLPTSSLVRRHTHTQQDAAVAEGGSRRQRPLFSLEGHTGCVHSVAFAPDGKTVASGSNDKT
eukprot:3770720-Rhodomonas_salina.1